MEQEVMGTTNRLLSIHYILSILYNMDCTENGGSNSSYIIECVFTAVGHTYRHEVKVD
jgi:hypothetical protein